jgi:excisionase family DNA binding protein
MTNTVFTNLSIDEFLDLIKKSVSEAISSHHKEEETQVKSDDLLSIEDIQKIFNVSKVTVHKWKKKGLLPFYKMNRKVYFKKSEVLDSMSHKKRKLEV